MTKKDIKPQWVKAGDWFVYGIVFTCFLVILVHYINPDADVGADYHYQKGFEDGQKNVSQPSQAETIYLILNQLKLLDGQCHQPICIKDSLDVKSITLFDSITNRSLTLVNDGTWTASWRDK